MAYYQNVPDKRAKKHDYSQDSWEEEGTRYRGASAGGRRFGPSSDRPARSEGGRDGYRGEYRGRSGEHREYRQEGRPGEHRDFRQGERRDFHDRPDRNFRPGRDGGDRREFRADQHQRDLDRRPPRGPRPESRPMPAEPHRPSYLDHEYHAPVAQPVMEPAEPQLPPENLLAGRNPIREALKSGRDIEKLLVQRGELSGSAKEIVHMAKEAHVPVQEVEKTRLDEIALHHQGMIAFASAYQYATVEEMLELAKAKNEDPFLILLDGITDPHNLGAIIRSAECVGAHGVIVPERRSVGLTPAAVKASAGAVEHLKVARVTNLNRTMEQLKKEGIWVYAVTMDGQDYEQVDFSGGCALVIGSEGEGISRLTLEGCDKQVSLPMAGELDSLNASVAAGVMMYRVLSCRRK